MSGSKIRRRTTELTAQRHRRGAVAGIAAAASALLVLVSATSAFAAALPAGPTATGLTGLRGSATRLSFPISDRVAASVDVGTGNLNVSATLLQLAAPAGQVPIGLAYNSRDTTGGSASLSSLKGPAVGWTWDLASAGSLSLAPNGTTVDYTTGDGAVWPFTQSGGVYTSPAGLKATLTKQSDGTYRLMFLQSSTVIAFDASGNPTSVTDRNGNATTIAMPSASTVTVQGITGAPATRTITMTYSASTGTTVTQPAAGSGSRSATVQQSSSGVPTGFTDAAGASTQFSYNSSGLLTSITNPLGAQVSFVYDSSNRVTEVDQANTTAGSAGTSTTRFSYPSSTSTLVAGPNTSTSSSVSAVAHATYTLNSNNLVTTAVDAAGRTRSATYTTQGLDVASSTTGTASGTPASVSTTYGYSSSVNGGLTPTSVTAQGGNMSTATYGNTAAATQYLPSATATDANASSASNTTSYTYNGSGNPLTATGNSAAGSSASGTAVTSTVTRNSDGTIASATAPGNDGNPTRYEYSDHQLLKSIPVQGTNLGGKSYYYDEYSRLQSTTDALNQTTNYTYDKDDRVLTTVFGNPAVAAAGTVTNTWDAAGNLTKQVSNGGTITNTYDQLGHLTSTTNTAAGGTIKYSYDKAGNNTSLTDTRGTTTQSFDATGVLLSTTYPKGTGTASTWFATDSNSNRTDTWLQSNSTQSSWAAHTHTVYSGSGQVARVTAEKGPKSSPTTVMDVTYCYNTAGSGTSCGTATSTDMSKLQWTYNALTQQTTKFSYDGMGRLTKVAESGGSAGNSTYAYTYDARGNRLTANVTGSTTSSQTLTYNAANQITTSGYTYDGDGNLTASPTGTYAYNAAQQMTSATVNGVKYTYTYAGATQNAVLSETGNGHTYNVVYGRPDQVGNPTIAQYQADGNTAYVEQDPVTGQATMLHTSSDVAALYVYDGTGSPVALLTDSSTTSFQYKYDPYGLPTLQQNGGDNGIGQNPYAFKSGIQDRATGFVKFGQRWYNPTTGTWTQQDTLDTPLDAANANRYAFASSDPVNGSDPTGQISKKTLCSILGGTAAIGGAVAGGAATYAYFTAPADAFPPATINTAIALGVATVGGLAAAGAGLLLFVDGC